MLRHCFIFFTVWHQIELITFAAKLSLCLISLAIAFSRVSSLHFFFATLKKRVETWCHFKSILSIVSETVWISNGFFSYQILFSFSTDKDRKNWQPDQTKKHSAAPPGIEPKVLRILVARSNHWATKPQRELRVNFRLSPSCQLFFHYEWLERATRIRKTLGSIPGGAALCFFVWSGCQFFYLCRCWKRREFDPDKSEFTI